MTHSLSSIILYSLAPVLAALLGATLAVIRPPGTAVRSGIQHFAAGVVFSVVAVELLPDVVDRHRPLRVLIGFT
jgi:ZIP family zinc transporter